MFQRRSKMLSPLYHAVPEKTDLTEQSKHREPEPPERTDSMAGGTAEIPTLCSRGSTLRV